MTSPLERAARAAQEADGAYAHESGMWMKEGGLVTDSHSQDIARAVLTAIREPSGALLDDIHGCSTVHDWRRMIDIILEVQDDDGRSEFEAIIP